MWWSHNGELDTLVRLLVCSASALSSDLSGEVVMKKFVSEWVRWLALVNLAFWLVVFLRAWYVWFHPGGGRG
jgi:hypothetical protein